MAQNTDMVDKLAKGSTFGISTVVDVDQTVTAICLEILEDANPTDDDVASDSKRPSSKKGANLMKKPRVDMMDEKDVENVMAAKRATTRQNNTTAPSSDSSRGFKFTQPTPAKVGSKASHAPSATKTPTQQSQPPSATTTQSHSRDARHAARASVAPTAPSCPSSSPSGLPSASSSSGDKHDEIRQRLQAARKLHQPFFDDKLYKFFAKLRHDRAYAHPPTEAAPLEAFFDNESEFATRVSDDSVRGMNRPRCAKFHARRLESGESRRTLVMRLIASVLREQCDTEAVGQSSPNVADIQVRMRDIDSFFLPLPALKFARLAVLLLNFFDTNRHHHSRRAFRFSLSNC